MQILSTKLSSPPLRSKLVNRGRLFRKLDQRLDCGFVLVSAPAGYGKSTLLSSWLRQTSFPVAWLSLDVGDNDPVRFLTYLAKALQKIGVLVGDDLGSALPASPLSPVETFLTPLVNQLAQADFSFWLVLDDYHVIQNQLVHDVVSFLLEHRSASFHLIIATRADPPLSLAKFRARAEMLEVRQADLCFSVQEAAEFLNQVMGLQISSEDVVRVTERTEGWIAGLQMAALSMQNTEDISGFITALSGTHHHIFDYLLEEILERQPPEIRRFLLYTSILDQFTVSLCDALLIDGTQDPLSQPSRKILEELERNNLFIQLLDHERLWYRYHTLFAELLRGYLYRTHANHIPELHVDASVWFEEQGLIPDAIHHALAASEWERVARLISANVFALLEQRELNTVIRQLDSLTGDESRNEPWLWIGRGWLAAYTGKFRMTEEILRMAEIEIGRIQDAGRGQTLRGHCAAIRAFCAWVSGERDVAVHAARQALDCLPETDRTIRCQSATVLGLSVDDLDEREKALAIAIEYTQGISVSHVVIFAYECQAYLFLLQGKLHKAYATCKQAIQIANSSQRVQSVPSLSHIYSTLSEIHREWNDLEKAVYYAREAVSLARRWEQVDALHYAYTNLGEILFVTKDIAGAFETLEQTWQIARRTSTWYEEITLSQEVRWQLEIENLDAALKCLREAQVDINQPAAAYLTPLLPASIAEFFLAKKQYPQALEIIALVLGDLEKRKIIYFKVHMYVRQALGYFHLGQRAQALKSLGKAFLVAASEGYMRSFLSSDEALVSLLHDARIAGVKPDYVARLLELVEGHDHSDTSHYTSRKENQAIPDPRFVEPLSGREMEVLNLLAQGYADKKIAENLVIARETVHKHLKNIYEKLGVHSRTEAVARSRELGLL